MADDLTDRLRHYATEPDEDGYVCLVPGLVLAAADRIDALTEALRKCVDEIQTRRNTPSPRPMCDWLMSAAEVDARKLLEADRGR